MNWAQRERAELADLFAAVGPDAPTLDEGWATRDLAAHLVIRERRPDAAIGIFVPAVHDYSERIRREVARQPWAEVVDLVRTGPPRWSPMALEPVDGFVNTVEFFVHHEDVRRARDGWEPRPLADELDHELWQRLQIMARPLSRRAPAGLVLRRPNGEEIVAKRAATGGPVVTVSGPASELLLFVYGRQAHARVDISAPDQLADAVRSARFGL